MPVWHVRKHSVGLIISKDMSAFVQMKGLIHAVHVASLLLSHRDFECYIHVHAVRVLSLLISYHWPQYHCTTGSEVSGFICTSKTWASSFRWIIDYKVTIGFLGPALSSKLTCVSMFSSITPTVWCFSFICGNKVFVLYLIRFSSVSICYAMSCTVFCHIFPTFRLME